jgi:hypothetical protein
VEESARGNDSNFFLTGEEGLSRSERKLDVSGRGGGQSANVTPR